MEPRITLITLGVADLPRAVRFYRDGLGWPAIYKEGGPIAFINTTGTRLSLYPLKELAADISPEVQPARAGFGGITLGHNVRTKAEVAAVLAQANVPVAGSSSRRRTSFGAGTAAILATRMAIIGRWPGIRSRHSTPTAL
jgi:hypothetical protein